MKNMIITIGRQYGSGGREIGEKLAGELGLTIMTQCFWKNLLRAAVYHSAL